MALITANSVDVIRGSIAMPKVGAWTADLVIDQVDGTGFSAGTAVTISAENGITLSGTVTDGRTGDFLDAVHVRIIGGAGGLAKTSTPRAFIQPGALVRDVLNGLASDSGEKLSGAIDGSFLNTNLTAWTAMQNLVSWNLRALLKWLGPSFSWRILQDGTLWMGVESWPENDGAFDILHEDPKENIYELGCESPFISPGDSLPGIGNVGRVEHEIGSGHIRSTVLVELPGSDRGTAAAIEALVKVNTAGFDFFGLYRAKVVSQSADLTTLDVKPDNTALPGYSRVPLRHGLPATKVQVSAGAYVLIGYMGGDPRMPYVHSWEGGETAQKIQLAGTHPLPLWDQFESALNTFCNMFSGSSPIVVVATGIPSPALVTAAQTIQNLLTTHALESQIVSNG